MKIVRKHHREYEDLANLTPSGNKKISVILPARNEHQTIGRYLPEFAKLMEAGFIHEVILADSSDDSRTINEFLSSALKTEPYASMIATAKANGSSLPVKAVSVFDPRFEKLFGKKKAKPGKAPGKGRTMYVGMAVATGDHYIFLDSDFYNIHPRFLNGLIGPLELDGAELVKATFELEDEWRTVIDFCNEEGREIPTCDMLMKSTNSRNIAKPLMSILSSKFKTHLNIDSFEGPLSGGYGAKATAWRNMKIPTRYGIEIYSLMQFVKGFPQGTKAVDVNLGIVDQTSADPSGQKAMGRNILGAFLRNVQEEHPDIFKSIALKPEVFSLTYMQEAYRQSIHINDPEKINHYAKLIKERLRNPDLLKKTFILPSLNQNEYFLENQFNIQKLADAVTVERIGILTNNVVEADSIGVQEISVNA